MWVELFGGFFWKNIFLEKHVFDWNDEETTLGFLKRSGEKVLTEEKIQHKNFPSECFVLFFQTWFFFLLKKKLLKITKKKQKKVFFKWIIFQKTFVASVLSCFSWKKKEKEFCSNTKKLSKAQTLVFAHKKNTDFHHKCIYFFESVTKWREKVKLEEFFFLSKQKKKNLSDGKKKLKKKCLLPKHFSHNKGIKHFSINYIWFYFWSFFCVKPSGKKRV